MGSIKSTYSDDFSFLVYGQLPNENEILSSMKKVRERIRKVSWDS